MINANERYTVEFDDANGSIKSLKSNGKQFIGKLLPLFSFRLRKNGKTELFTSDDAAKKTVCFENGNMSASFAAFGEYEALSFCVRVNCREYLSFSISFDNGTDKLIEWIDYPQIAVPADLERNGGHGKIVFDYNEGLLTDDFNLIKYRDPEYPNYGVNKLFPAVVESQFMAYYDDACGIYLAAEDADRGIKGIDMYPFEDSSAIKLQFRLYPGVDASEKHFELPYPMVVKFFNGDWYNAAEIYRSWFEKNLPKGLTKLSEDKTLPEWYFDSPLTVTYPVRGIHDMDEEMKPNKLFPYNNALPHLEKISEETDSRIMALLMHWEGTAPWCPPYVWPPMGSVDMLRDFADKLHKKRNLLGVYCSGLGYTLHSNLTDYSREDEYNSLGLEKYMCAPDDGTKPMSHICQEIRISKDICPSTDFAKDVLSSEAEKITSIDIDYVQILDQNHGGTPYFCYSDKHSHPPVPGPWQVREQEALLKRVKDAVGNTVLGCESAASESYIPFLKLSDNRFNLTCGDGRPVPIYSYIYHEYLNNFSGNSVCSLILIDVNRSPECHVMRLAYSFVAGDLMTLVINQDGEVAWSWGQRDFSTMPEREPIMKFIKSATALRRGVGKKYLCGGRMVRPLETDCEKVKMYRVDSDYYSEYPSVLSQAYKAQDGDTAQVFANYTKNDMLVTLKLADGIVPELLTDEKAELKIMSEKSAVLKVPAFSAQLVALKER